jgi:hypothetical protein
VFSRYRRTRFLEDAAWLGVPEEAAFSRAELRRRRDQLMAVHHPDRGGDAASAARVNETYKRMVEWLDRREALASRRADLLATATPSSPPSLKSALRTGAAKVAGAAVVAFSLFVALRGGRKR